MNTFALPSHCCPPTYLGNKTIIQWRDNDFRDQTTFEFQIGHTNLCPVQIWSKLILYWSKQFWTQNLLGLKFVLKRHFWPSSKYFGPCRNLFWKPKKSKSESKPKPKSKSFIYQFELRKSLLLMTLFDCSNVWSALFPKICPIFVKSLNNFDTRYEKKVTLHFWISGQSCTNVVWMPVLKFNSWKNSKWHTSKKSYQVIITNYSVGEAHFHRIF